MDDSDFERVPIDDWPAVVDAVERFAPDGDVETDDDSVSATTGSARIRITRDGAVETGMPLHGFAIDGIEAVYVDAERGLLQIREGVDYEFRRP